MARYQVVHHPYDALGWRIYENRPLGYRAAMRAFPKVIRQYPNQRVMVVPVGRHRRIHPLAAVIRRTLLAPRAVKR